MAKSRLVNTIFWEDNYTANLDPIEKLLFLYFLTNTSTTISGIYQITIRKAAVETGIDKEMVEKILKRFEKDNKMFYQDGWLGIKNFIKNQNQQSPQVKMGIERELENVPEGIKFWILNEGSNTVSEGIQAPSYLTKPNLTKPNLTKREPEQDSGLVVAIIEMFSEVNPACKKMYGNKTQRAAAKELIDTYGFEEVKNCIQNVIPRTNGKTYFPTVTTPAQLRDKWVSLKSAVAKKRNNTVEIIN